LSYSALNQTAANWLAPEILAHAGWSILLRNANFRCANRLKDANEQFCADFPVSA
jgi:hypothetical protein